jgi:hypothetical protein
MSQETIRPQQQTVMSQEGAKQPSTEGIYPFSQLSNKKRAQFKKIFEQHWPLLKQGFSFPLHDSIDHEVMEEQSGTITFLPTVYLYCLFFLYFAFTYNCIYVFILYIIYYLSQKVPAMEPQSVHCQHL